MRNGKKWMGATTCRNGHDVTIDGSVYIVRNKGRNDHKTCKICVRERVKENWYKNHAKNLERQRENYRKNSKDLIRRAVEWAKKNPEKRRAKDAVFRKKRREWLDSFKMKPCADCGVEYIPCVMDFDHTGDDKDFDIGLHWGYTKERLEAEIKKCEVVCSNCHRIRIYERRKRESDGGLRDQV